MAQSTILGRFDKDTGDVDDYKFDFTQWLISKNRDSIDNYTAGIVLYTGGDDTTPPSITSEIDGSLIRVIVSSGTPKVSYKITVTVNTVGGLTKSAHILLNINDPSS
jgi:hypothetical protein